MVFVQLLCCCYPNNIRIILSVCDVRVSFYAEAYEMTTIYHCGDDDGDDHHHHHHDGDDDDDVSA